MKWNKYQVVCDFNSWVSNLYISLQMVSTNKQGLRIVQILFLSQGLDQWSSILNVKNVHKVTETLLIFTFLFWAFRVLTTRARKLASQYNLTYQEQIPVDQLVQKVANVMQEFTQSGLVSYQVWKHSITCFRSPSNLNSLTSFSSRSTAKKNVFKWQQYIFFPLEELYETL